MNPLDFFYVYNGGGVAVGDLNGNGRTDLYFAGNTVSNRLYLNEGHLQFRDVTNAAGLAAEGVWPTGVTLVDINQDGRTDIYVSVGGPTQVMDTRANRLYVNQGVDGDDIPASEERAEAYGIAGAVYSTHAAFFDYDHDRDLDLYVLNTATVQRRRRPAQGRSRSAPPSNRDRLHRNDGDGTFTEVTEAAGIGGGGYGLGLAVSDVNDDGWPDVYTANDIYTRDRLYVNQGDGTFIEQARARLRHQSYSAMGVDIADVNNGARNDIFVLDMLPQDPHRRRMISNVGAHREGIWQYGRNTFQLHNRTGPDGPIPFSELVTHLDFTERRWQPQFSGTRADRRASLLKAMADLPKVDLPNRFFENLGAPGKEGSAILQFAERTAAWLPNRPGISNGAAFADLDRDGDLDLVANNINREATILENHADRRDDAHSLRVDLQGSDRNRSELGTGITLIHDGESRYHDHSPDRGYQSTVEDIVHFGLGADSPADSLRVRWPDGTSQLYIDVAANQVVYVSCNSTEGETEASLVGQPDSAARRPALFRAAQVPGLEHRHRSMNVLDLQMNPLLPHRYSQNGPGIAVGDVDGNGLDDLFVGAGAKRERTLHRQVEPARRGTGPPHGPGVRAFGPLRPEPSNLLDSRALCRSEHVPVREDLRNCFLQPSPSMESPSTSPITRRQALRRVGALLGGAVSAPTVAGVLSGCQRQTGADWSPSLLSPAQNQMIDTMAEVILPATDTPGASAANVNRFVDAIVGDSYLEEDRERFMKGLEAAQARVEDTYGAPFGQLSEEQQAAFVAELDDETFGPDAEEPDPESPSFYRSLKELVIVGYYTSEVGATQELRTNIVPGYYDGDVPYQEIGRAWSGAGT